MITTDNSPIVGHANSEMLDNLQTPSNSAQAAAHAGQGVSDNEYASAALAPAQAAQLQEVQHG